MSVCLQQRGHCLVIVAGGAAGMAFARPHHATAVDENAGEVKESKATAAFGKKGQPAESNRR